MNEPRLLRETQCVLRVKSPAGSTALDRVMVVRVERMLPPGSSVLDAGMVVTSISEDGPVELHMVVAAPPPPIRRGRWSTEPPTPEQVAVARASVNPLWMVLHDGHDEVRHLRLELRPVVTYFDVRDNECASEWVRGAARDPGGGYRFVAAAGNDPFVVATGGAPRVLNTAEVTARFSESPDLAATALALDAEVRDLRRRLSETTAEEI